MQLHVATDVPAQRRRANGAGRSQARRPAARWSRRVGRLFRRQLEPARNDPRNRDVLVQLLPTQSVTTDFNLDARQLFFGGCGQDAEPVSGEADSSSVVQLNVYGPP